MRLFYAKLFPVLFSIFPSILGAKELIQGVTVHSVYEMHDPSVPCGLNLERVLERQARLRAIGVNKDLTFTLSWLQKAKKQAFVYAREQNRLLEKFHDERLRQPTDHHASFMQKLKELFIKATSHDLTSLQTQLSLLERKIALNKKNQARLERRVEHEFLLEKEQVSRLPPTS
ncbi:MAG: hypothetical protein H2057_01980 [Alphaproteobacteria bacterium]|nr:hypothetical protein [Alphaproteobacteria bacterium]